MVSVAEGSSQKLDSIHLRQAIDSGLTDLNWLAKLITAEAIYRSNQSAAVSSAVLLHHSTFSTGFELRGYRELCGKAIVITSCDANGELHIATNPSQYKMKSAPQGNRDLTV